MQNLKLFIISILESLLIVSLLCILFFGYLDYSSKHHKNYELIKTLVSKSDSYICEVIVLKALEQIPISHIKEIKENDYKIIISTNDLFEKYEKYKKTISLNKEDIGGLAIHSENLIVLKESPSSIYFSILHEVGHCIDEINDRISNEEEFSNCFNLEKEKIREYAQKNEQEYFADIYGLIYSNFPYFFYNIKSFPLTYSFLLGVECFIK